MLNIDPTILSQVVNSARLSAADHPRWLTAIDRAVVELAENPWIARGDDSSLIIASPSGKCYTSNGVCQCLAFDHGQPCWHRAAARLVRLHDEAQARQQRNAAYAQACTEMDELYA
jgi:hypothetical protein